MSNLTNGYKKQITERIRVSVNNWIDELKVKHKELLLTKQWKIRKRVAWSRPWFGLNGLYCENQV